MKKMLLILALIAALTMAALSGGAAAKQGSAKLTITNTYCNMWNVGQNCVTPWNYTHDVQINNGGAFADNIYCFAHHPDGSWTGGTAIVNGGQSGYLHPTGYNQTICTYEAGPGGFPIAIYTYQG